MGFENALKKISKKFEFVEKSKSRHMVNMTAPDDKIRLGLNNDRLEMGIYFGEILSSISIKDKVLNRKLTQEEWAETLFRGGECQSSEPKKEGEFASADLPLQKINSPKGKLRDLYELLNKKDRGENFFNDVHKAFSPLLRAFLLKWLNNVAPDKAKRHGFFVEDALQEVFLTFHRRSDEVLKKYDKPADWFFVVSKRRLIDCLRSQSKIERHEKSEELAHLSLENDIEGEGCPADELVAEELDLFLKKKICEIKSRLLRESATAINEMGDNLKARTSLGLSECVFRTRKKRIRQILKKPLLKSGLFDKRLLLLPKEKRKIRANSKLK